MIIYFDRQNSIANDMIFEEFGGRSGERLKSQMSESASPLVEDLRWLLKKPGQQIVYKYCQHWMFTKIIYFENIANNES